MNKWIRAQMAVENGVDLVVELPFAFSCNQAEYFAMGACGYFEPAGLYYLSVFWKRIRESGYSDRRRCLSD